jgi:hypothetical protein
MREVRRTVAMAIVDFMPKKSPCEWDYGHHTRRRGPAIPKFVERAGSRQTKIRMISRNFIT